MKLSKNIERKVRSTKPSKKVSPKIIQGISSPYIKKIGTHKFETQNEVPIFEVSDYRALNQLIGYAKFLNTDYGDVYYRGEVHLHQSLLPSISRKPNSNKYEEALNNTIRNAITDKKFSKMAKLSGFKGKDNPALIVEALLQHYGYSTHFVDLVDNHWIALWFGLNQFETIKCLSEYCYYKQRNVNPIELVASETPDTMIYQYMLLVAVDNNAAPVERGIYVGNEIITIVNVVKKNIQQKLDTEQWHSTLNSIIDFFGIGNIKAKFPAYKQGTYFMNVINQFESLFFEEYVAAHGVWNLAIENFRGDHSVPIMTIHKSKGLEYNAVYFIGLEDSAFWNFRNQPDEDRCTFFVALSRAKASVTFTFCKKRTGMKCPMQRHNAINEFFDLLQRPGIAEVKRFQNR